MRESTERSTPRDTYSFSADPDVIARLEAVARRPRFTSRSQAIEVAIIDFIKKYGDVESQDPEAP